MTKIFDIVHLNGQMYGVGIEVGTYHEDSASIKKVSDEWIFSASYFGRILCPKVELTSDPSLNLPLLPAVEEDVETLALKELPTRKGFFNDEVQGFKIYDPNENLRREWINGYKAASAKRFSEEDMKVLLMKFVGIHSGKPLREPFHGTEVLNWFDDYIQSLTPKPKQVEVEMEPIKEYLTPMLEGISGYKPAVEKGFVKVKRWIYE